MTETEYSMALPELRRRIRAYDLGMDLSDREITRAINRAGLIEMGRRIVDGKPTRDRYVTTKEILAIEPWLEQHIHDGKGKMKHGIMSKTRARALLKYVETAPYQIMHDVPKDNIFRIEVDENGKRAEQGEAVINILSSNNRYTSVVGLAGTGKTTLMQRLNWICQESDINVRGLAFTGKAAAGLQNESGIQSSTIHAFLNRIEKQSKERWKPDELKRIENSPVAHAVQAIADKFQNDANRDTEKQIQQDWDLSQVKSDHGNKREIWVIDEAGLVDMKLMKYVMEAAEKCNAQIVFSGDPDQLPPVGKGEAFRWMIEKYGIDFVRLTHIMRQRKAEEYEQESVKESVLGDPRKSLKLMEEHGDLREFSSTAERRKAIISEVTDNATLADYKDTLLLVSTNADRKMYDKRIRDVFVQRGEIEEGKEYTILSKSGKKRVEEKRHFAIGDRIIFGANKESKGFSVKNGEMGRIVAINGNKFTVEIDGDTPRKVTFDITKYKDIDHAYAVTLYKSQGMTVKRVVVDFDTQHGKRTRNELYVAISRMKLHAICFTDNLKRLAQETQKFAVKVNAEAHERGKALLENGVTEKDVYKAHEGAEEEKLARRLRDIAKTTGRPISQLKGGFEMEKPPQDVLDQIKDANAREQAFVENRMQVRGAVESLPPREKGFWTSPITEAPQSIEQEQINKDVNIISKAFIYSMTKAELFASGKITLDMENDKGYIEKQHDLAAKHEVVRARLGRYQELRKKYDAVSKQLDVSRAEDKKHNSFMSIIRDGHYDSKTPKLEREADRLQKDMERVKKEFEYGLNEEMILAKEVKNYSRTFDANIDRAIREREPMIAEYDKAIKQEDNHIKKMNRAVKQMEKAREKLHRSQVRAKGHQRTPHYELSDRAKQWAAEHVQTQNFGRGGEASQTKTRIKEEDLPQNIEVQQRESVADRYESAIGKDERGAVYYEEPYEVIEGYEKDLKTLDRTANENVKQRVEIMRDVKDKLEQTPEFNLSDDTKFQEIKKALEAAKTEAAKAKDAEDNAKTITKDRADERAQDESELQKSKSMDSENAQKSKFNPSRYLYVSETPEKRANLKESRAEEAKAKEAEAKATKAREAADKKVDDLKKALDAHMSQRSKALNARIYKVAPVLNHYDDAISRQRGAAQEIRAEHQAELKARREAARAAEREQSRDCGHSFR